MPFSNGSCLKYLICITVLAWQIQITAAAQIIENNAVKVLETLLSKPEAEIDLVVAKLTIDKLIDPSIDVNNTIKDIGAMVSAFKSGIAPDILPIDKILSLGAFLYESGNWNGFQPFQYDFADPFGQAIKSKLISSPPSIKDLGRGYSNINSFSIQELSLYNTKALRQNARVMLCNGL